MKTLRLPANIDLTPEQIAELFYTMDNIEQCQFFNAVAQEVIKNGKSNSLTNLEIQMCSVTDTLIPGEDKYLLTKEGRQAMKIIGDYSGAEKP